MGTMTKRRACVKPKRFASVLLPTFGKNPGVVRIRVGKVVKDYLLQPIGSDFGDGFAMRDIDNPDAETYHVNLSNEGHICDCRGHLKHGHCKHPEALAALRLAGKL